MLEYRLYAKQPSRMYDSSSDLISKKSCLTYDDIVKAAL